MAKRPLVALFLALGIAILLPTLTYAAVNPTGAGLVPCGVSSDPTTATQCEACNAVQLVQNIITFLIGISIPIAMAMFAYAGILYFTSGAGGGNENISKAKRIFQSSLFGFVLALTSWLIVNTVLYTVLDKNLYPNSSWFRVDCTTLARPVNTNIGTVIANHLGIAPEVVVQPSKAVYSCKEGYALTTLNGNPVCMDGDGKKVNPNITYDNPTVSTAGGSCSSFTSNSLLACISSYESSCNPAIGSSVDIGSDGNAVSWGLTQWNLSANSVKCTTGGGSAINLNCPAAFGGGAYTASNHDTFVKDKPLFDKCVQAVQDPTCNLELASNLLRQTGGSVSPWGNAVRNNCR